jgi:hypothetical protein
VTEEKELEVIAAGNRLEQFLTDPAVLEAIEKLDRKYYDAFKACVTADEVAVVKARSSVLVDVLNELRVAVSGGKHTSITRDRRERSTPKKK